MQLPYLQEKTWGQRYGYQPGAYISTGDWPVEDLPMTYQLGNSFWSNVHNGRIGSAAADILFLPATEIVDAAGNFVNQASNGYTRLYNNAAALLNNAAAEYDYWRARRNAPQTALTGRKITYDMNPGLYNPSIAIAEEPSAYFVKNGQILGEVKREYPYVSRVVQQPNQLEMPAEEAKHYYAMAPVDESVNLKRTIARGLASMVNNGKINDGDLSRTQKLINLYNKIK